MRPSSNPLHFPPALALGHLQRQLLSGLLILLLLTANFAAALTMPIVVRAASSVTTVKPPNQPALASAVNVAAQQPSQITRSAVLTSLRSYAWGYNFSGQLGNGTNITSTAPVPVNMPSGVVSFTSFSGGSLHTLGRGNDGKLYSWGGNREGELGNATNVTSTVPVLVSLPAGVTSFIKFEAGEFHNLALGNDGKLYAWGYNGEGSLGNGTFGNSNVPTLVNLPTGVTSYTNFVAGARHSLGFGNDGRLYAWGNGTLGALGNGTSGFSNVPVLVTLPTGVTAFTKAAAAFHNLALGDDGKLYGWGYNSYGELGNGSTTTTNVPVLVNLPSGVTAFTDFETGGLFSFGFGNNGKLYAWGRNAAGELGNGTNIGSTVPITVSLPTGVSFFTKLSAGNLHNLALGDNNKLYAWGYNFSGELGNGTTTNSNLPIMVNAPDGAAPGAFAAGNEHSLANFAIPVTNGGFHPLPQFRLYDSRLASGGPGPFAIGETRTITAISNTGVVANPVSTTVTIPPSAKSIVVNFTAVQVSKGGFLTAYQTGITRPVISTLNWYYANQIVANSAIVDLNSAGQFDLYFGASSGDLTVDVIGYIDDTIAGPPIPPANPLSGVMTTAALTYQPISSTLPSVRAYDSRTAFGGPGPLATGLTRTIPIRGQAGVPASAKAVIINLTAINSVNRGFLAAFPGSSNPGTASVSFNGNIQPVVGNLAVVYLDNAGAITVLSGGTATSADFAIDVFGYYDSSDLASGGYVGLPAPVRHYDSRLSQGGSGPITTGTTISAPVSLKLGTSVPTGVPANAHAVVIHLAVANTVSNGYLALYGVNYQGTSSLNWAGDNQLVSNLAVVDLAQLDNLKLKMGGNAAAQTDFIIDIIGYIP